MKKRSTGTVSAFFAVLFLTIVGFSARSQVFSPGLLSAPHHQLESLAQCDKCHSTANRADRKKCLSCHKGVRGRIRKGNGFHGQPKVRGQQCSRCHQEHRGTGHALVQWPGGKKERFNHNETGWSLKGAHAKVDCAKCHDARLMQDAASRARLKSHPGATAFTGLPTGCNQCHFDEHRGQLGNRCDACHDEVTFKKQPGFRHDRAWPLKGAHRKVVCNKCHKPMTDANFRADAFFRAKHRQYLQMSPLTHNSCVDCHKDPHRNRFGTNCLACHTQDTWTLSTPPRDTTFHDRTAFPLKGRHRFVSCDRCHRKDEKNKTILRPIAHDRCDRCHPNAHPDRPRADRVKRDCAACHDNSGYTPSRYSVRNHRQTRFPLRDAHLATACTTCHLQKMGAPLAAPAARRVPGHLAALVISPWRMRSNANPKQCGACHPSPHRKQFSKRACTDCHTRKSFSIAPGSFDHKRTDFPLVGKHQGVACAGCHFSETDATGQFIRYRSIPHGDCVACHTDIHYGQFTVLPPVRTCRSCHSEKGFKPVTFSHNDPARCAFPLKGKHAKVECAKCHPRILLAKGMTVTRYRPTVRACSGCHEDQHGGAYAGAGSLISPFTGDESAAKTGAPLPWEAPQSWYPQPESKRTNCAACHTNDGWSRVSFDHGGTAFPLRQQHLQVPCDRCHGENGKQIGRYTEGCVGCHRDPHRGRMGASCTQCHTESGFQRTEKMAERHSRTNFPLLGRHGALPCSECHRDARNNEFNRTPSECVACHAKDVPAAGASPMDHSTLSSDCAACHTPIRFATASFQGHDRCFPINMVSRHGGVGCTECHQGGLPTPDGTCDDDGFSCIRCHSCLTSRHRNVADYSCTDRRCYQCHLNP